MSIKIESKDQNGDKATGMLAISQSRSQIGENGLKGSYDTTIGAQCMAEDKDAIVLDPDVKKYPANASDYPIGDPAVLHETDENGKLKLKPNSTYICGNAKYQTDSKGRVVMVAAKVSPPMTSKKQSVSGANVYDKAVKDGKLCDDNGHIIGYQIGGSDHEINLLAQNSSLNRGAYRSMENLAKKEYQKEEDLSLNENREPEPVYMLVELTYDSNNSSSRPNGYIASVEKGDEVISCKCYKNNGGKGHNKEEDVDLLI